MTYRIAGIDVHKRMLAVVIADVAAEGEYQFERRKVGTSPSELCGWFGGTVNPQRRGFLNHFHHRHGHVALNDIVAVIREAGLNIVETGSVGTRDLQFVVATVPNAHESCCGGPVEL